MSTGFGSVLTNVNRVKSSTMKENVFKLVQLVNLTIRVFVTQIVPNQAKSKMVTHVEINVPTLLKSLITVFVLVHVVQV